MDNHKKAIETAVELVKNGKISREAAEKIFPELRESEDERIRKEIISLVLKVMGQEKDNLSDDKYNAMLAWLEKQKEQKHPNGCFTCDEYKKGYEEGRRNGFTAGYNKAIKEVEQKEQKPIDANHIVNAILSALSSGLETDEILKARGFTYDDVENWLNSTRNPAIEYIRGQNKIFENPEKYGLQKEHKPAEWSEEDEKIRKALIAFLEMDTGYFACDGFTKDDIIQWLKSPRPQPKAEWSKEDEDMLSAIEYCVKTKRALAEEHYKWIEEKLKSIRPYWIPTDKQMESIRYLLEDYAPWTTSSREARQDLRAVYNELLKYKRK